ncbi:SDR family oxidoreductase [Mesorhizobium sp. ORM6]
MTNFKERFVTGRLTGKVTLISGAASGIGRETARLFAREGAEVFLGDIDSERRGRYRRDRFAGAVCRAQRYAGALMVGSARNRSRTRRPDRHPGQLCRHMDGGDFIDCSLADWQQTMDINATGTFLGCRAAVKAMKATGNLGSIVNISSIYGNIAADDAVAYAASKGAVRLLTKGVALYCAANALPIRCNSVHPTYVDSEMLERFAEAVGGREMEVARLSSVVPMRKLPSPLDIAEAILFLGSDAARLITGAELPVDGGMLAGIVSPAGIPARLVS